MAATKCVKCNLVQTTSGKVHPGACFAGIETADAGEQSLIIVSNSDRSRVYISSKIEENRPVGLCTRLIRTANGSEHVLKFKNPFDMLTM